MRDRSKIPFWFEDELPGYVADPDKPKPRLRKRVRRKDIAESFNVNIRTVDYWWRVFGVLPAPHYLENNA
jgi:hypothetical protein